MSIGLIHVRPRGMSLDPAMAEPALPKTRARKMACRIARCLVIHQACDYRRRQRNWRRRRMAVSVRQCHRSRREVLGIIALRIDARGIATAPGWIGHEVVVAVIHLDVIESDRPS